MRFVLLFIGSFFVSALMGQSVVINEVLAGPQPNPADYSWQNTANANSLYSVDIDMLPPFNREFIELYNTDPCDTIDISCYTLGSNAGSPLTGPNWGAFTFPPGTKIPPLGFIVLGGNDAQVPYLDFNITQYRQSSFNVQYLCGDPTRWFLRDAWGWIALYDQSGSPVDAIYWTQPGGNAQSLYAEDEYSNQIVNVTACNGTKIHLPANQIPGIEYVGTIISGSYLSFQRAQDGSPVWYPSPVTPTPRGPNGQPVQPATLNFNVVPDHCSNHDGKITVIISSGGTGPYTVYWNGDTMAGGLTLSNLSAGSYTIQVNDASNCLISYDTIVVVDDAGPTLLFNSVKNETCSDGNGEIITQITGGTMPYSISWNTAPPLNTASISGLSEGSYHITVVDHHGCVVTDSVFITNHLEPTLLLSLRSPDSCGLGRGVAIALVTGEYHPYQYTWNTSPTQVDSIALNLFAGNYSVTVSDGVCTVTDQINVPLVPGPIPDFIASPEVVYVEDGWIHFTDQSIGNIVSWLWDFDDGAGSGLQNPSYQYASLGQYQVVLTIVDDNGCPASTSRTILVKDLSSAFFPNAFSPNGDGLNDEFKPVSIYITQYRLLLFDRFGRAFFESNDPEHGWDGSINGQPAPDGVYVWVATFTHDYGNHVTRNLKMTGTVTLIR